MPKLPDIRRTDTWRNMRFLLHGNFPRTADEVRIMCEYCSLSLILDLPTFFSLTGGESGLLSRADSLLATRNKPKIDDSDGAKRTISRRRRQWRVARRRGEIRREENTN